MPLTRWIAITGAALTVAALLLQYYLQFAWMPPGTSPLSVTWRYFGYFTILTNWLVVAGSVRAIAIVTTKAAPRGRRFSFQMVPWWGFRRHTCLIAASGL